MINIILDILDPSMSMEDHPLTSVEISKLAERACMLVDEHVFNGSQHSYSYGFERRYTYSWHTDVRWTNSDDRMKFVEIGNLNIKMHVSPEDMTMAKFTMPTFDGDWGTPGHALKVALYSIPIRDSLEIDNVKIHWCDG